MKRFFPLFVFSALFLFSCSTDSRTDADRDFEELTGRFLDHYLRMHPEDASALGVRAYDHRLNDYSADGMAAALNMFRAYRDTLRSIRVETLSAAHMIDYDIFQQVLEEHIFELEELREWEWNPLTYNVTDALYHLIAREGVSLESRMRAMVQRLQAVPAVLESAQRQLTRPPAIHTQTAIQQNAGGIALLENTLPALGESLPPTLRDSLHAARDRAVSALRVYGHWLRADLLQRSTGDFRLGRERYARKFALQLETDMPPEQLLAEAERLLVECTDELDVTATSLFPVLFPGATPPGRVEEGIRRVLDRLADDHLDDSTIVGQAEAYLTRARDFVRTHDLVTVPDEPLEIIVMPEFQRGVAVAYCDSPGALEKDGKTFFAIAPTPEHWTPTRKLSFYREYNRHMLKNLVVHEAMPGHFLQLATANSTEAPTLLRSVFPSGVFAEGWATYCEQLMADTGFGGQEMKMQQLKMYLRLLINAILDQRVHAGTITEREAMQLMTERGFQEEGEAAGKWRRACLTSVQLSTYLFGNLRMRALRERAEAEAGSSFSLRGFHDTVLSYGTISPKYHPMLMKLPAPQQVVAQR